MIFNPMFFPLAVDLDLNDPAEMVDPGSDQRVENFHISGLILFELEIEPLDLEEQQIAVPVSDNSVEITDPKVF